MQTRRNVRCLADDRLLLRCTCANQIADNHKTRRNSDSRRERRAIWRAGPFQRTQDLKAGANGSLGIIFVRERPPKVAEHAVAHVLGDLAIESGHLPSHSILEAGDDVAQILGIDLSKQQQSSDWGAKELSKAQAEYAASDVLYLHRLKTELSARLVREGRLEMAEAAFRYLPDRAVLDLAGWAETDIFAH